MAHRYNWTRLLYPRGAVISLTPRGFFPEPESFWAPPNAGLVTLVELRVQACVVVLGEPGIGKSSALEDEIESLRCSGEAVAHFQLREFHSDSWLVDEIFRGEAIRNWKAGQGSLWLMLDGLDECKRALPYVADVLQRQLRELPTERLRLRIACRTYDWPGTLEAGLQAAFRTEKSPAVMEVAPLSQADVEGAATTERVDTVEFLRAVIDAGAAPFAIKPVTLRFLIDRFKRCGTLPQSQEELYRSGCLGLCGEENKHRRSTGHEGNTTAEARLQAATLVAAGLTFSGADAVFLGPRLGAPDGDLIADQIADAGKLGIAEVRGALATGLFSSRGGERIGLAHRSYGDFLAASYLKTSEAPIPQLESLLLARAEDGRRVVPQLRDVAAWATVMNREFFELVCEADPLSLLESDVAFSDPGASTRLAHVVSAGLLEGRLKPGSWLSSANVRALHGPELGPKLQPLLAREEPLQYAAISIALRCGTRELCAEVARIALDETRSRDLREVAASLVVKHGNEAERDSLLPLASIEAPEYSDLRCLAIRALWPARLTTEEALAALPVHLGISLGGGRDQLCEALEKGIEAGDLPCCLRWLEGLPNPQGIAGSVERLVDRIFCLALERLADPAVFEALVVALVSCAFKHTFIDRARHLLRGITSTERARVLLSALVLDHKGVNARPYYEVQAAGLVAADVPTLISVVRECHDPQLTEWLASCIRYMWDDDCNAHLEALADLARSRPDLAPNWRHIIGPVALDSPAAQHAREAATWERERRGRHDTAIAENRAKITAAIQRLQAGDATAFIELDCRLGLSPADGRRSFAANLTEAPGWADLRPEQRVTVVAGAEPFLLEYDPGAPEWITTNSVSWSAVAGYHALRLLASARPGALGRLTVQTWSRWLAAALSAPNAEAPDDLDRAVLGTALATSGTQLAAAIAAICRARSQTQPGGLWELRRLADVWGREIEQALAEVLAEPLPAQSCADLLKYMLAHGSRLALERALALVSDAAADRDASVSAAVCLLEASTAHWPAIWGRLQAEPEWGKALVEEIAGHYAPGSPVLKLCATARCDLLVWLCRQYRPQPHRGHGARFLSALDRVEMLWVAIANGLAAGGDLEELRRAGAELGQDWLGPLVDDARAARLRAEWAPTAPTELFALLNARDRRLVKNSDDLLAVMIEALHGIQADLGGLFALAQYCWNTPSSGERTHKTEEEISCFVAYLLQQRLEHGGVVVNREVRIRYKNRTDILVTATARGEGGANQSATLVVECKGDWNRELPNALGSQLVAKYLEPTGLRHGIYLTFWCCLDEKAMGAIAGQLNDQAASYSPQGLSVRAVVLSCRFPSSGGVLDTPGAT